MKSGILNLKETFELYSYLMQLECFDARLKIVLKKDSVYRFLGRILNYSNFGKVEILSEKNRYLEKEV